MKEKVGVLLFATLLILSALAFGAPPDTKKNLDIFAIEKGNLAVDNGTSADLVLFAGRPEHGNMLGGIRARSRRSFDLAKIENMPQQGAFILRAVLAETYQKNKSAISAGDVLYTGFVVYNMIGTELVIPSEIDETMSFSVTASNMSRTVCLLRLDGPNGLVIAALAPLEQMKRIWLKPSDDGSPALLWPVFVDAEGGTINSISAERGFRAISESRSARSRILTIEQPDFLSLAYDYALVRVVNDTNDGILFGLGALRLRSRLGTFLINSGIFAEYELHIPMNRSNWELDTSRGKVKIQAADFKVGYRYTITLTEINGKYSTVLREDGNIPAFSPRPIPNLLFE